MRDIVLKHGSCDECGTYGVSRFFEDGSFEEIIKPCYHEINSAGGKTRTEILQKIKQLGEGREYGTASI